MICPICKKDIVGNDPYNDRNEMSDHLNVEHNCTLHALESFGKPSYESVMEGISDLLDGAANGERIRFIRGVRRITMWGLRDSKIFSDENMDTIRKWLKAQEVKPITIEQIRIQNARIEAMMEEEEKKEWEKEKSKRNRINTLEID